jgi:hypothetical protein
MSRSKALDILNQVRAGEEQNRALFSGGPGSNFQPEVTEEGWTAPTEDVPAQTKEINEENKLNISNSWPPSRSPLL